VTGAMNVARIGAFMGETGSGKSSRIKVTLVEAQPRRLMIWDPKREYRAFGTPLEKLAELGARALGQKEFRLVFHPQRSRKSMRKAFDKFCQIADRVQELTVVADELADVTEPNWAPEGWEMLTRQGRHAAIVILGASQSPADLDKTFFGNCSMVSAFRVCEANQVDRMAKLLAFDREGIAARRAEIAQLGNHESLVLTKNPRSVEKIITTPRDLARIP
jgi:hypothetical protein